MGNGHRCPNKGKMHPNLEAQMGGQKHSPMSVFQIADITCPLMSVSKRSHQGSHCTFTAGKAIVRNAKGDGVREIQRRGGLYVVTMKLKKPDSRGTSATPFFPRPAR